MPQDVYSEFRKQVTTALAGAGVDRSLITLMVPPRPEFGDLSTNAAFELASRTGGNPRRIAQGIPARPDLQSADLVARTTVAGAGYLSSTGYKPELR